MLHISNIFGLAARQLAGGLGNLLSITRARSDFLQLRGCIKIKFFGTPSFFMLPENLMEIFNVSMSCVDYQRVTY